MWLSLAIMPRNRARGDYNAALLYSPLKIILKGNTVLTCFIRLTAFERNKIMLIYDME